MNTLLRSGMAERQNLNASPMHACRSSWLSADAVTALTPSAQQSIATVAIDTFSLEVITGSADWVSVTFVDDDEDIYTTRPAAE